MDSEARLVGRGYRVLVVDDEPDITALIAYQLTLAGFRVETAADGAEAMESIGRNVPDLLVLDRMLPGMSGDEILKRLRSVRRTSDLPILVLTAKKEQEDRIEGLQWGADDYMSKPFSPRELVLRACAILRRAQRVRVPSGSRVLQAGPISMDVDSHQVVLRGDELSLTPTEFRLLRALMEGRGRTQDRNRLLEKAWDLEARMSDRIATRTVDMHVRRLRAKLGDVGDWVQTVRGFGYRLTIPEGLEERADRSPCTRARFE